MNLLASPLRTGDLPAFDLSDHVRGVPSRASFAGGAQVSNPSEKPGQVPGKASEDERQRIFARAKPLPPVEETRFEDLTEEQDRIFWETINNA